MILKYSFEVRESEIVLDGVKIEVDSDQVQQYLSKGELTFYHARGIIVGCAGAGKTTLMKRLMDTPTEQLYESKSTEIADVYVNVLTVMDDTIKGEYLYHSYLNFRLYFAVIKSLFSNHACHFNQPIKYKNKNMYILPKR